MPDPARTIYPSSAPGAPLAPGWREPLPTSGPDHWRRAWLCSEWESRCLGQCPPLHLGPEPPDAICARSDERPVWLLGRIAGATACHDGDTIALTILFNR